MSDTAAEKCPSKLTGIGASGAVDPCERPAGHGGDHAARNGELVWEDWGDRPTCEQRIAEAVAAAVKPWRDGVAARVPDTYCPDESDGPADLLPGLDDAVARAVAAEQERCATEVEHLQAVVRELYQSILDVEQPENSHPTIEDPEWGERLSETPHPPSYWIGDNALWEIADAAAIRGGDDAGS